MRNGPTEADRDTAPAESQATGGNAGPAAPAPARSGNAFSLRNWRVRNRLIAVIVIPLAAAVLLGGLRLAGSVQSTAEYQRIEKLADLGSNITTLVANLSDEQDITGGYIAAGRPASGYNRVKQAYSKVDGVAGEVKYLAGQIGSGYGSFAQTKARTVINRLNDLPTLRTFAVHSKVPALTAIQKYNESINDFVSMLDEIAQGGNDRDLAENVRTLSALSRAKAEASVQRGVLFSALTAGHFAPGEANELRDAKSAQDSEFLVFQSSASDPQKQTYDDTVIGSQVDRSQDLLNRALSRGDGQGRLRIDPTTGNDAREWYTAMSATVDRMRTVESGLVGSITTRAHDLRTSAQTSALVEGIVGVILLLFVVLIAIAMARSMTRPLRRLREGALAVAKRDLPDMVDTLRNSEPGTVDTSVRPIDVNSSDEIGQVARSFDEVHREAVRLAADEALLRGNVNAMFVNLSRRSQSLIERQLRLIDGLEQGEQDGERLGSLFKLDHLATRMRRNGENLLVLAGQDAPRRWSQPVPLVDVLRASLSEVEQYERVQLQVQPGFAVVGQAVNDIVHLVAELVENATTFSPQDTRVSLNAQPLSGGGVMLDITDNGIGMPPEECAEVNRRLAEPPVVDVSVSRRMGLFVVGRLATRHGIRVQLRPAASGGLTVLALLPDSIVTRSVSGGAARGGRDLDSQLAAAGLAAGPVPESPPVGFPGLSNANGSAPGALPEGDSAGAGDPFPALGGGDRFGSVGPASFGGQAGALPPGPAPMDDSGPYPAQRDTGEHDVRRPGGNTGPFRAQELPHGIGGGLGSGTGGGLTGGNNGPGAPAGGQVNGLYGGTAPMDAVRPAPPRYDPAPADPAPADHAPVSNASEPVGESGGGDTGDWPVMRTGPDSGAFPVVSDRASANTEERSPIFDAIESEWFRRSGSRPGSGSAGGNAADSGATAPRAAAPASGGGDTSAWRSPGDEGWQAAAAASTPTSGGTTNSGLPKRVPRANLVPGAAGARRPGAAGPGSSPQIPPAAAVPAAPRSADAARSRMSSFQQGVRNARAASRDEGPEDEA
ncbi:MAG TPA: sensor histidine kinase [Streptosporangiaceae bacterium]